MPSVHRSLAFSFIEKFSVISITLISYVLIARLLTPEEIGIYSVSAALIAIGQVIREFGVGNFLIQEKNLTQEHIRTAFGVSLLIGGALFLVVAMGAPLVGDFYNDQRMTWIVRIIALNFLVMPFCSISLALLRRDMQFGQLTRINIATSILGTGATLGLAYAGFGPQSLAWGAIATNVATGLGGWIARKDYKVLTPALSEWRKVLTFGSQSAGAGLITSLAMGMNDLAVGRLLGFASAAILSRANGLVAMFNQQFMDAVRSVALPALAKADRNHQQMEPIYITSVTAVTAVAWPFYGFVALEAKNIIRMMFGSQWDAAAELVPIFCLCGALAATYNLVLTLAIAIGRNDLASKTDFIMQPIRALIVVSSLIIFSSLEAVAWATLFFNLIGTPYLWFVKNKLVRTDMLSMRLGLLASFKVTLTCLFIPLIFRLLIPDSDTYGIAGTLSQLLASIILWAISIFWYNHPLSSDPNIRKLRNHLVSALPILSWIFPVRSP